MSQPQPKGFRFSRYSVLMIALLLAAQIAVSAQTATPEPYTSVRARGASSEDDSGAETLMGISRVVSDRPWLAASTPWPAQGR